MDIGTLSGAVDDAFATTGASTPPWPDPHAADREPAQEEYSRCLDPGKYLILKARADAWVRVLTSTGLATVEPVADPAAVWRDEVDERLETAVRLRPSRAGAVPLLLGFRRLDEVADAIVVLGAGDPAVLLTRLPFCGCDACDDGSEMLLRELDEHIAAVVNGALVHVASGGDMAMTTGSGRTSTGRFTQRGRAERALDAARAGRSRYPCVAGLAWH
jgi:hypothetical protein